MNLSVYLSELLKTNDCVIIPDLGGFIANYQPAHYNGQSDQFTPPTKEIIFSSKLKKNDGLLVNFVSEREGVGYMEARKIVSEFVAEYLFKLENGEKVEFEQIGTIRFDQNEHLLFEAGIYTSPRTDAFGLDTFHFPELVNKFSQPVKPVFRDKAPEPQRNRRIEVNRRLFDRSVVKYLLIAIPVLVLLYFLPVSKLLNRNQLINQQAPNTASLSISDTPLINKQEIAQAPETAEPETDSDAAFAENESASEPIPEENASGKESAEDILISDPKIITEQVPVSAALASRRDLQPESRVAQTIVNEPPRGRFHVVGGCFKVRENADNLAEELVRQGYPARISNMGKSFYRVTVESYQTRKEAEQTLKKLLNDQPDAGYWLMADKR